MLIILPDERFGLKNVIKKLDVKTIENIKDLDKVYRGSWMKIMNSIRRREKALQINKEILMT